LKFSFEIKKSDTIQASNRKRQKRFHLPPLANPPL
jgi:hypothetical protein